MMFVSGRTTVSGMSPCADEWKVHSSDAQVRLYPSPPIPRGWCCFELDADGNISGPRVYFDVGGGFSANWSIALERVGQGTRWRAIAWLPRSVFALRLDPTDTPGKIRWRNFRAIPWHSRKVLAYLARPGFAISRVLNLARRVAGHVVGRAVADPLEGDFTDQQLFRSPHSHLSGASLRLGLPPAGCDAITVEVSLMEATGPVPIRSLRLDPKRLSLPGWEHVYWEHYPDAKDRDFLVRVRFEARGSQVGAGEDRALSDVRAVNSPPQGNHPLPEVIVFSPVTQCNLNCVHCISRPTRDRVAVAPEAAWQAIADCARRAPFLHAALDYSGDILWDEGRHGGLLSRLVELDFPYRVDTNANCLDDGITERLLDSRLTEINFSIDSMDARTYRGIRKGSIPLDDVLRQIAHFMRRKRETGRPVRTILSFVLMRRSAATIRPAFAFAKEHGIDHVSVVPLIAFTPDMVEELLVWDLDAYRVLYEDLRAASRETGVELSMQPPVDTWREGGGHAPCYVPFGATMLLGNGDVVACCVPGTRIGNLAEGSLESIWNGPTYREFRMRVNSPDPPLSCRNCPMSRLPDNRLAYAPVLAAAGRQETRIVPTPTTKRPSKRVPEFEASVSSCPPA